MIILYELVDFIEVIQIKMFALYAEVPFDRFGKELRFVGVCLGNFVVMAQCWMIAMTICKRKFLILCQDTFGSVSKLIELQNFSQLACISTLISSLTCSCNWLMCVFKPGFHIVAGVFRVVTKYSKYPNDQVEISAPNDSKYPSDSSNRKNLGR